MDGLKGVIVAVRNVRGEMNISPAKKIPVLLRGKDTEDQRRMNDNRQFLSSLAKLESLDASQAEQIAPVARDLRSWLDRTAGTGTA